MKFKAKLFVFLLSLITLIMIGLQTPEVTSETTQIENTVDMSKVTEFEATETGFLLHFEDGTGYYWEKGE